MRAVKQELALCPVADLEDDLASDAIAIHLDASMPMTNKNVPTDTAAAWRSLSGR